MILKSIVLRNIRSYTDQKICFPEGSVMLSGDIGSGKSTILLAVEFALFGLVRGDVPGESLLRNGKNEGSVELRAEISGKEIIVCRNLKRTVAGVRQESGYIIADGAKSQKTSTELKAEILEILGYPKDLITKSKGLIYRFTVFTPQEEMKKILFEDGDARINTLRRVFDVDKYRRIRENARLVSSEIKGKAREIAGFISDTEEKKKQADKIIRDASEIELRISSEKPALRIAKDDLYSAERGVNHCESEVQELLSKKSRLAVIENELRNLVDRMQRCKKEHEEILTSLQNEKPVSGTEPEKTAKLISEKEAELADAENSARSAAMKTADAVSRKKNCVNLINKISAIDSCPTCLQKVGESHKKSIEQREKDNIATIESESEKSSAEEKNASKKSENIRNEISILRKRLIEEEKAKAIGAENDAKKKRAEMILSEQEDIKRNIGSINSEKIELCRRIENISSSEESYAKAKKAYEDARKKVHESEIRLNQLETEHRIKSESAKALSEEIAKKESATLKLKKLSSVKRWIDEVFVMLMESMEKQIMANVYSSFNSFFQQWFSTLMEDESVTAKLDDNFSPVVHQNGYDTSIAFLSGGEKTSCALAYRLSLNRVINDLMTSVNTRGLIILDEPTDGFSSEQLDRVREVIEQLGMRQVIIVSHEQKVEGFVDNVIRVSKNNHSSFVE